MPSSNRHYADCTAKHIEDTKSGRRAPTPRIYPRSWSGINVTNEVGVEVHDVKAVHDWARHRVYARLGRTRHQNRAQACQEPPAHCTHPLRVMIA